MQNRLFGLIMCTSVLGALLAGVYIPTQPDYYFLLSGILAAAVVSDALGRKYNLAQVFGWAFGSVLLAPVVVPRWYATRRLRTGEERKGGSDANYLKAFGMVAIMFTGMSCALNFLNYGANNGFELIIQTGFSVAGTAWVLSIISRKESVTETGRPVIADTTPVRATAAQAPDREVQTPAALSENTID